MERAAVPREGQRAQLLGPLLGQVPERRGGVEPEALGEQLHRNRRFLEAARGGREAAQPVGDLLPINTEMVQAMKPEAREKIAAGIPAKRLGEPDEIAQTVEFIFQNDYVSGRCFDIDGGLRL